MDTLRANEQEEDVFKFDENDIDYEAILERPRIRPRLVTQKRFEEAPEFVKRLNAFEEAKAGSTVVFTCQYKAFPKPAVKWYKDDEEVSEDKCHIFGEGDNGELTLTITEVCKEDEGAFKCKVENQDGVASTTGYLSVTGSVADKPLSAQPRKNPDHCVSFPPHLRTIVEQKSVEEREAEAAALLPPSPIQDFIDSFRRGKHWAMAASLESALTNGNGTSDTTDDDKDDVESTGSGSDTSVDSQDFDRIMDDVDEEIQSAHAKQVNSISNRGQQEPSIASVVVQSSPAISLNDVGLSPSVRLVTLNNHHHQTAPPPVVHKHVSYDVSWLYYLGLISMATFAASSIGMSPTLYILFMAFIALISFQFLVRPREEEESS